MINTIAAMVPGNYINWEGALAFNTDNSNSFNSLTRLNNVRLKMYQDGRTYSPVMVTDEGHIQGAVMWADIPVGVKQQVQIETQPVKQGGTRLRVLPDEADYKQVVQDTPQVVEMVVLDVTTVPVDDGDNNNGEEQEVEDVGDFLVDEADAYVDGEEEGIQEDGAETGEMVVNRLEQSQDNPMNSSREQIGVTKEDPSLDSIKQLAKREANGYKWEERLLFKYQLDQFGNSTRRLCVPLPFRDKCMVMAHDNFGHKGKNKVAQDLARLFYWPSLWRDVTTHCRSGAICQQFNKAKPRLSPMEEREVITVPSERVAIDLVGPLPKARGGCEYLLTCMDIATRWPEAVALSKTTASVIVKHLTTFFSRNGFPGVILSDNRPQFLSKTFQTFCMKNGIQHVKTSVYCPESNGVLERFHGTLKQMVAKCTESRGSWSDVLPMCLFFLRLTPNSASGFSPFMLTHGWEPDTPSQLLYDAWVGKHLGSMSVDDWVRENCERVQQLRDKASANYHSTSA